MKNVLYYMNLISIKFVPIFFFLFYMARHMLEPTNEFLNPHQSLKCLFIDDSSSSVFSF